ncbi:hypothetical protein [Pseudoxanthomonas sp. UTMC 1351]|uniref:hypothetical protein n=1 Tax=Pseudoxanthomonas sp. UTMC 1351 TaxID=2695853 RepID=UPI0034CDB46A
MPAQAVPRSSRWLAPSLLLLGGLSFIFIWILLALYLNGQAGWMALLGAVDVVLMLRFGGMPHGLGRSVLATAATAGMIVLANWGIAATQIGFAMGLNPWESAVKLGPAYAWTLSQLANSPSDLVCMAAAVIIAAWFSR